MFVKKLLNKASRSRKSTASCSKGLRPEDVDPRLVFHYGVPTGANSVAYDPSRRILGVSTRDGRIKLFGSDNTQALLESDKAVPSKFLQFVENQGILLNVRTDNNIEVWDLARKELCHVHLFQEEITSFAVLQQTPFMYVGDSHGNISVLELDIESSRLSHMKYRIPFSESHGRITKATDGRPVLFILPKPMSNNKRVLIIFEDGIMSLWEVPDSKVKYVAGAAVTHPSSESRKVLSACWACPCGSKAAVGYSTGDIFIWNIPEILNTQSLTSQQEISSQNTPLLKLNLCYKVDKIPVVSLRWISGSGSSSRLYIYGVSDRGSSHSFQVVLLNENTESRTVKMVLPVPESCQAMEIVSGFKEQNKHAITTLVLLLKSGLVCTYDDSEVEKYLLQSQSKSGQQLPNYTVIKMPHTGSSITASKLYREDIDSSGVSDEDLALMCRKSPDLFSTNLKEGNSLSFSSISKTTNLYITGHQDGSISFWDISSPLPYSILSIKEQGQNAKSVKDACIKALYYNVTSKVLISGSVSGEVSIYTFKENSFTDNLFSVIQAKQGCIYTTNSLKVTGSVLCINMNPHSKLIAIGTDEGYLSIINMEGGTLLYQKHFSSEVYPGIMSLQFHDHVIDSSIKNVVVVGTEGSSFFIIEENNGHPLISSAIAPKNPSIALLMQVIDDKEKVPNDPLLLVCSEKAVRLYCLSHAMQGIKRVCYKKKLHGSCCWASTFSNHFSDCGIVLMFDSGRIEIRSIPELNLLKEISLRGLAFSTRSKFDGALCSSSDGELIMIRGNQEILYFSVSQKDAYRLVESVSQVCKDKIFSPQGLYPSGGTDRGKKKGLFNAVVREMKGGKEKEQGVEAASPMELSDIFSTCNYPVDVERQDGSKADEKKLDIDDIDLEDREDTTKGNSFAALNKQLGNKFNAIKGKIKVKSTKSPEIAAKEEKGDAKSPNAINEIKKKYGYTSTANDSNVAEQAHNKLQENLKKLQGIETKSSEMQNTAHTFSSTAKELLRVLDQGKKA